MTQRAASGSYYKWLVVGIVWLIACLNYTDRMTIFSVFPVLKRELGFSDIALALLGSTFLWSYAICSPVGGYLGDRFPRRRIILGSLLAFSVVTAGTGLVHNPGQMIALRCLLGFTEAIFLPAALAYVASFHTDETRSLANSIALTGLTAGAGLGGWYGGFMAEHYSWRLGFFGLGAVGVAVAILGMLLLRKDPVTPFNPQRAASGALKKEVKDILQVPTARALIFLAFAISLTSWPTHSWVPTYLFERFHLTLTRAGSEISLYAALPALIGGIIGGILADRWSRRDVRGRMAVQIFGFCVMAPTMLAIGFMPTVNAITFDLVLYSVARGMLECNSMPIFCSVVPPARWSMAYGLYNFAGTLAGSLGIFLVGAEKSSWGIANTLSAMSCVLFAGLVVMAITVRSRLAADIQAQLQPRSSIVQSIERS